MRCVPQEGRGPGENMIIHAPLGWIWVKAVGAGEKYHLGKRGHYYSLCGLGPMKKKPTRVKVGSDEICKHCLKQGEKYGAIRHHPS